MSRAGSRTLLTAALFLAVSAGAGAATRDDFLYGTSDGGNPPLPFRYFVPPGYDAAVAYPLILFLHGSGERGSNNESQLNNDANGAMRLLDDANLALQPVFMVAPQCPTNGWWSGATLETAISLIDQMAAQYHVDPDRIYLTGLSMGGMGAWSGVTAHPERFAAVVPMSGNGATDAATVERVRAIPLWFFHAANDGTVGVAGSDAIVAALRDAGADTVYTRYATGGHVIWPVAYAHPQLFPWLVSQSRGHASDLPAPTLRITQPTAAEAWATTDATVDLGGDADLGSVDATGVAWSVAGGASGTADGTTDWSAAGIPLALGTNLIRVTASGPSGHAAYGGSTSVNDHLRVTRSDAPPQPGDVVVAINAGGPAYTAADGTPYAADGGYDGGSTQVSDHAVAATEDDALYNDWRFGDFAYHLVVPPGSYLVELQFADTYNSAAGQRMFDAAIEGRRVLHDFDIIAEAGVDTALVRRFEVDVADGVLDLAFANGSAGNARLDAFRVVAAEPRLFADGFDGAAAPTRPQAPRD